MAVSVGNEKSNTPPIRSNSAPPDLFLNNKTFKPRVLLPNQEVICKSFEMDKHLAVASLRGRSVPFQYGNTACKAQHVHSRHVKTQADASTPTRKLTKHLGFCMSLMEERRRMTTSVHGQYDLKKPINKGGNGMVCGVDMTPMAQSIPLAAKFTLNPGGGATGIQKREFETLEKLRHVSNIPRAHHLYEYQSLAGDQQSVMVMDRFEHEDLLRGHILKQIPCHLDMVCAVFTKVLDVLMDLEQSGYTHCDIKPSNILFEACRDLPQEDFPYLDEKLMIHSCPPLSDPFRSLLKVCRVKVIDFGACTKPCASDDYVQTRWFRSPLSFLRDGPSIDLDLFSLGATLYEMYTHEPLYGLTDSIIQCLPEELQEHDIKSLEAKNLAHLHVVDAISCGPSQHVLRTLCQAKVLKYYHFENGTYFLKPLPVEHPYSRDAIQTHLFQIKQRKMTTLQNTLCQRNEPPEVAGHFISLLFDHLLNVSSPPKIEEMFSHPFFAFFQSPQYNRRTFI